MNKLVFLVLVALSFQSCIISGVIAKGKLNKKLTVENNAIPPDIGKDNTYIICVLVGRESRDKYLRKNFSKYYHGNYEFLDETRLKLDGYDNIEKYRYVFTFTRNQSTFYDASSAKTMTSYSSSYYVIDRKLNKTYDPKYSSSYFGKYIKAYAANLEKQRLANEAAN